jgi:hypothetical protein
MMTRCLCAGSILVKKIIMVPAPLRNLSEADKVSAYDDCRQEVATILTISYQLISVFLLLD